MDQFSPLPRHPVLACAARVHTAVDEVAGVDPVLMTAREKAEALVELSRAADRLRAVQLRVLAVSDDVADDDGARSPAAWLAHHTLASHGAALADARVADALEHRWSQARGALLAGAMNLEQAQVITRALDDLPDDLDADVCTGRRPTSSRRLRCSTRSICGSSAARSSRSWRPRWPRTTSAAPWRTRNVVPAASPA